MSAAAYTVTQKVRHLSAWTKDDPITGSSWTTGSFRPICGARVAPPSDVMTLDVEHTNRRKVDFALSRPVCRRCVTTLAALTKAAQQ